MHTILRTVFGTEWDLNKWPLLLSELHCVQHLYHICRSGYIICEAQCKMKMGCPWFKNYQEFRGDGSRALDQVWGPSGCRALWNRTGHVPGEPACRFDYMVWRLEHDLFILFNPQGWVRVPEGNRQHVWNESFEEGLTNVIFKMLWAGLFGKTGWCSTWNSRGASLHSWVGGRKLRGEL